MGAEVDADRITKSERRIRWIDAARGIAIILIVMHHARDYALAVIPAAPDQLFRWAYIDPFLLPIRLPLFFLISGLMTSGILSSHTPGQRAKRTVSLALVYLFWSIMMLQIVPDWPRDLVGPTRDLAVYAGLLEGRSVLWYLWALVLAFAFSQLTRRLPAPIVLLLACVTSLRAQEMQGAFGALCVYLPFYCCGHRYPQVVIRLVRWRGAWSLGLCACLYLVLLVLQFDIPAMVLGLRMLGVAVTLALMSRVMSMWPGSTTWLEWLGLRTLPIYVLHFPIIAWLGCAAMRHADWAASQPWMLWSFLPALTFFSVGLSLVTYECLSLSGLGWTLAMPPRRRGQITEPAVAERVRGC
jgi:uncharacterized membrane protein YcfT